MNYHWFIFFLIIFVETLHFTQGKDIVNSLQWKFSLYSDKKQNDLSNQYNQQNEIDEEEDDDFTLTMTSKYPWILNINDEVVLESTMTLDDILFGKYEVIHPIELASSLCPKDICSFCHGKGFLVKDQLSSSSNIRSNISYPCPVCFGFKRIQANVECVKHFHNIFSSLNELSLFIPPGSLPGQELQYNLFQSIDSLQIFKKYFDKDFPPSLIKLKLNSNVLHHHSDQKHLLTVYLSKHPYDLLFGFEQSVSLSEYCQSFLINRRNQFTKPDSSLRIPLNQFRDLFLCMRIPSLSPVLEVHPIEDQNSHPADNFEQLVIQIMLTLLSEQEINNAFFSSKNCIYHQDAQVSTEEPTAFTNVEVPLFSGKSNDRIDNQPPKNISCDWIQSEKERDQLLQEYQSYYQDYHRYKQLLTLYPFLQSIPSTNTNETDPTTVNNNNNSQPEVIT